LMLIHREIPHQYGAQLNPLLLRYHCIKCYIFIVVLISKVNRLDQDLCSNYLLMYTAFSWSVPGVTTHLSAHIDGKTNCLGNIRVIGTVSQRQTLRGYFAILVRRHNDNSIVNVFL